MIVHKSFAGLCLNLELASGVQVKLQAVLPYSSEATCIFYSK